MNKMKKQLIISTIAILLIVTGLSGCTELTDETDDTDKVELLIYSVETQKKLGFEKIDDGFIHSEDSYRYVIDGTVKNIASEMLDYIKITVKFYDINDTYLDSRITYINFLEESTTWDFSVQYTNKNKYFQYVDHVEFEISV